jgi:hypothetical protein
MWRRVAWYKFSDISKEHIASFFRIEEQAKQAQKLARGKPDSNTGLGRNPEPLVILFSALVGSLWAAF